MRMKTLSGLLLSISVLAVAACSGSGNSSATMEPKTAAPTPPASLTTDVGGLTEADTLTPQDVVAVSDPVMLAPLSTQPEAIVEENTTLKARIAKLEETVNSLRRDYDRIMPAFASLNTTNERIQTLLDEIEQQGGVKAPVKTSAQSEPMSKPVQPLKAQPPAAPVALAAPLPLTPETKTKTVSTFVVQGDAEASAGVLPPAGSVSRARADMNVPPAIHTPVTQIVETKVETQSAQEPAIEQAQASLPVSGSVKGLRIGEHGNKTRLVIDLAGNTKPDVTYDLDNTERVLVIDMPATAWGSAKSGGSKASAFVSEWNVQDNAAGGSSLAIQLKKGAKILSTEYLKASGNDSARLVIDLGPSA